MFALKKYPYERVHLIEEEASLTYSDVAVDFSTTNLIGFSL